MSILTAVLSGVIGGSLFLFVFWKRLREDYSSSLIFSSGAYFIFMASIFSWLSQLLSRFAVENSILEPAGLWFWGSILGFIVAFALSVKKLRLRWVETLEAAILGGAFWLLVVYGANLALSGFAVVALLLILFYFLDKNYKRFSWYKSGRVGFSGLLAASVFFTIRAIASFVTTEFSTIGRIELVPSAVVAFLLLFSLYNLSEG